MDHGREGMERRRDNGEMFTLVSALDVPQLLSRMGGN
jgi:hypothetical protein